ncbi:MAG TPA: O-antigen ligase family protein [Usitatibacter sp.]|nr:O-antigen ligase family protein [Usitatibacter sp.]
MRRLEAAVPWLLCAFLLVLPFTSSVAVRNVTLSAAGLILAAAIIVRREAWHHHVPPARVLLPIGCWFAWCAASVAWSQDPAYSAAELRPALLPTFAAFVVFHAATRAPATLDRWAWALAASLGVLALAAFAQEAMRGDWDANRWHGGVGPYSSYVVLALPMLAWLWLRSRDFPVRRAALVAVALATLVVTFWTENRMVWPSLAAMALAGAWFAMRGGSLHDRRRGAAITVMVVAALCGVFVMAIQARQESKRQPALEDDPRIAIWAHARQRMAEAPWIGHGYGRGILAKELLAADPTRNPLHWHGHNLALNVALQTGLVGLALFVWTWAALLREMARGLRAPPPARWCAALGITIAIGFALKNMTDDAFVRHVALLGWSLAGALTGIARETAPARS